MSDLQLVFDHLGVVTVRQILGDPARFVGETLADPLEGVVYGTGKALVMRSQREPGRLFIHSFAHGGGTYDLKYRYAARRPCSKRQLSRRSAISVRSCRGC